MADESAPNPEVAQTETPTGETEGTLQRIATDIATRLEELRPLVEEVPRLEAALAALEGRTPPRSVQSGRG